MDADPFGTAAVRERVLAAWSASAARFREDANAEEDLALGGYRDRVVVELAQNAADAAARAGVPGRLLLRLTGRELLAANVGAPLDADGVQALATLRASAKRDDATVGRFGVGFSAVLALTDTPAVRSGTGGVAFSGPATRELVRTAAAGAPDLAAELGRRDGHVPVLRLPFPDAEPPPSGWDTAVVLPLRDQAARDLAATLLDEVDDVLLLALPGLAEVTVEVAGRPARVVRDVAGRWHALRRTGRLDDALLAGRPTEERGRTTWSLTWAVPAADPGPAQPPGGGVLHAPTPTDEPLPWPALLVATFPLDPARRHVQPGPVTDALVGHAARAYAELLRERALAGADVLPLVPGPLATGALDGALRAAALEALAVTPLLPAAGAGQEPALLRPCDAVALEGPAGADAEAVGAIAASVGGLVAAPRGSASALAALGVRRMPLADVVEALPPADPAAARRLYGALAGLAGDATHREALAAVPVPLADGRVVRGVRGLALVAGDAAVARALQALGVRAVHPDAAHPLLERLGATAVGPRAGLALPAVQAAVLAALDDEGDGEDDDEDGDDLPPVTRAVLTLLAAALAAGDLSVDEARSMPWLRRVLLPDDEGDLAPAAELVLPGSWAEQVMDEEQVGVVDGDLLTAWGRDVLSACGVLTDLGPVGLGEVPLEVPLDGPSPASLLELPDWELWLDDAAAAAGTPDGVAHDVVVVPDLDLVDPPAWPQVLERLAGRPDLRAALLAPVRLATPDGRVAARVPGHAAWWLARELAGGRAWADPDAVPLLAHLLPAAPPLLAALDPPVRAALGGVRDLEGLGAGGLAAALAVLADDRLALDVPAALDVWRRLAVLAVAQPPEPLDRVRVLARVGGGWSGTRVVPAEDAVVVDSPMLLQRADLGEPVVGPPGTAQALADLLDVEPAVDRVAGRVEESGGVRQEVPAAVRALLPEAPSSWCEHDDLVVDGVGVDWWVDPDGVHACTLDGLARGLAWAAGRWAARAAAAAVLSDPQAVQAVLLDGTFD